MQNKPNLQKSQMNVNKVLTRDYDKMDTWSIRKTKPIQSQFKANSKPIQSQSKPIKANIMPKQSQFKPNSNPIYRGVASGEAGFQSQKHLVFMVPFWLMNCTIRTLNNLRCKSITYETTIGVYKQK
jgi:hypothetical protein